MTSGSRQMPLRNIIAGSGCDLSPEGLAVLGRVVVRDDNLMRAAGIALEASLRMACDNDLRWEQGSQALHEETDQQQRGQQPFALATPARQVSRAHTRRTAAPRSSASSN